MERWRRITFGCPISPPRNAKCLGTVTLCSMSPVPSSGRPVPATRREEEKPREAREDTSSSSGSEVTSWSLIPAARGIWVSGKARLRATSLPSLSLEIHF